MNERGMKAGPLAWAGLLLAAAAVTACAAFWSDIAPVIAVVWHGMLAFLGIENDPWKQVVAFLFPVVLAMMCLRVASEEHDETVGRTHEKSVEELLHLDGTRHGRERGEDRFGCLLLTLASVAAAIGAWKEFHAAVPADLAAYGTTVGGVAFLVAAIAAWHWQRKMIRDAE